MVDTPGFLLVQSRRSRCAAVAAITAMLLMGFAAPAAAQPIPTARGIDRACPPPPYREDPQQPPVFRDTRTNIHFDSISCAAMYELVHGVASDRYRPGGLVTRGQMASLVWRMMRLTGASPEAPMMDFFEDTLTSVHRGAINSAYDIGVVEPVTARRFAPNAPARRGDFAATIARAIDFLDTAGRRGVLPVPDVDYFEDDDGTIRETDINRLAAQGIVVGRSVRRFDPDGIADRAEAATLLMRAVDYLDEQRLWTPPYPNQAFTVSLTLAPSGELVFTARDVAFGEVDIGFLDCSLVEAGRSVRPDQDEDTQVLLAGEDGNAAGLGDPFGALVDRVDGSEVSPSPYVNDAPVRDGTVSFRVTAGLVEAQTCVVGVVFADLDDNDALELYTPAHPAIIDRERGRPTEPFAITVPFEAMPTSVEPGP